MKQSQIFYRHDRAKWFSAGSVPSGLFCGAEVQGSATTRGGDGAIS